MAGHFLKDGGPHKTFPDLPQFSGFMRPTRYEGDVANLEVQGTIPGGLDGTFYRVMPDPQLPPYVKNDLWFNGDGCVGAFRVTKGSVHFKQRYVRTEKFQRERAAQRALLGKYRNKYTDAVDFKIRTTANTNIIYFNGRLLACKEDAAPYTMDPNTLETVGLEDFDGQLPSLTFTAHPKLDPVTSEMICMGYEAKGDGTPDVCYYTFDAGGRLTETVWLVAPVVAMIHDFAVTDNWVLFPMIPQTCDLERMKEGGDHWQWNPEIPFYIGVLPRRGAKSSDIKWFRAPNSFPGHTANAFEEEDGTIAFDLPLYDKNAFYWWPDAKGNSPDPRTITANLLRFIIDPKCDKLDLHPREVLLAADVEFPRIDDRFATKKHNHTFFCLMEPAKTDFPAILPVMGGGYPPYNAIGHLDNTTKKCDTYFPGPTKLVQEAVFAPRMEDAPEGDGYLLFLVNNYKTMLSELHIVDTTDFSRAQAIVDLPLRLRAGVHGNWVDAKECSPAWPFP